MRLLNGAALWVACLIDAAAKRASDVPDARGEAAGGSGTSPAASTTVPPPDHICTQRHLDLCRRATNKQKIELLNATPKLFFLNFILVVLTRTDGIKKKKKTDVIGG